MAQPDNFLERIGRILRNAALGANVAENPAVATASGWRLDENGEWVQDQMNNPGVKRLRGNLSKIGAAGALGAAGLAGASMAPLPISSYVGGSTTGSYSIPVWRAMLMTTPTGQTFSLFAPTASVNISKQAVTNGLKNTMYGLGLANLGIYGPRFLAEEEAKSEEAPSEGAAQPKPEEAALPKPKEEEAAPAAQPAAPAPQEPKPKDDKDNKKPGAWQRAKDVVNVIRGKQPNGNYSGNPKPNTSSTPKPNTSDGSWTKWLWSTKNNAPNWNHRGLINTGRVLVPVVGFPMAESHYKRKMQEKDPGFLRDHLLLQVGKGVLNLTDLMMSDIIESTGTHSQLYLDSMETVKPLTSTQTSNTQVKTPEVTKTEPDSTNTPQVFFSEEEKEAYKKELMKRRNAWNGYQYQPDSIK